MLLELSKKSTALQTITDGSIFDGGHIQKSGVPVNDDWVLLYERIQERLARRQREKDGVQHGVFYTPYPIAHYLVKQTLGVYLTQQLQRIEHAVSQKRLQEAHQHLQHVAALKIIDPACGTGVFLVEALKNLHHFYQTIQQQYPALSLPGTAGACSAHSLYGADLDPASVAITQLRLAQWVCRLDGSNEPEHTLINAEHFRCADTLSTPIFAGTDWDFVLGNPPYVSEVRKQSRRFTPLQNSEFYQPKMDLCDAFTLWAIQRLQPQGQLAYVLPEYWTQRTSSGPLRDMLWQAGQFQEICTFGATPVFKNAPGHHTALLIWQKRPLQDPASTSQPVLWSKPDSVENLSSTPLRPATLLKDSQSGKFLLGFQTETDLLKRLSSLPPLLASPQIQQGVVLPQGRLKNSDWPKLPQNLQASLKPDSGIFLLNASEVQALQLCPKERALLKPYFGPAGFLPFQGLAKSQCDYQLVYTDRETCQDIALHPESYPRLKTHLDQFKPVLTSAFKPYGLHRSRQKKWFESPEKILCARQVMLPAFAVVSQCAYVSEGFNVILPEGANLASNLAFYCALLNSQLAWYWFYHQKRKGLRLQMDKEVLLTFPQPLYQEPTRIHQLSTLSQSLAYDLPPSQRKTLSEELNELVYEAYGITAEEKACILALYHTIFASP
jgi:hypothetical protein